MRADVRADVRRWIVVKGVANVSRDMMAFCMDICFMVWQGVFSHKRCLLHGISEPQARAGHEES